MKSKIKIREYKPEDLAELIRLVGESDKEFEAKSSKKTDRKDFYRDCVLSEDCHPVFVASVDSKLVGFTVGLAGVNPTDSEQFNLKPEFYFFDIYVSDGHRQKGIGKILQTELTEHAKKLGYKEAIGIIDKLNKPSIALHKSLGMKEDDLGSNYKFYSKL